MKVEKIDRISVGVKNLDEAEKLFSELFGLKFERVPFDEIDHKRTVAEGADRGYELARRKAAISSIGLTLVETVPPVEKEGVRAFHLKVSDLEEAKAEMKKKGIRLLSDMKYGNLRQAAFGSEGLHGCRIVLAEHKAPRVIDAMLGK